MTTNGGTHTRRSQYRHWGKLIPIAGLSAALVATVLAAPSQATFRGKNGRIVYSAQTGKFEQLFTVRPDGSDRRQITRFTDSSGGSLSHWSHDGTRIVFTRRWNVDGPNEREQIYVANANGSNPHPIKLPGVEPIQPTWFPDGRRILFLDLASTPTFKIVNADGTGLRNAGMPPLGDSPCVFGDGKRVAVVRPRTPGSDDVLAIFVVRLDTRSVRRITPWGSYTETIDCSPDGTRVVFGKPAFGPPRSANVFTIRTDGTGLTQLTHSSGGTVNNNPNSWSPDGTKIVFTSNRGGRTDRVLFVMNADGSGVRQLTRSAANFASWGTHR
jgi:Tol biopolymer transport system component